MSTTGDKISDFDRITADVIASVQRVDKVFGPLQQERENHVQIMRQLQNERLKIENETLEENRKTRRQLIWSLSGVSFLWLFFTGFMVCCLAFGWFSCSLSDVVATAFITTSLATVLGLWMIGLRYFFSPHVDVFPRFPTQE